jgi:hypothetical protein
MCYTIISSRSGERESTRLPNVLNLSNRHTKVNHFNELVRKAQRASSPKEAYAYFILRA